MKKGMPGPSKKFKGEQDYAVRIVLRALYIKEHLGLLGRDAVEQIIEKPYLQYLSVCLNSRKKPHLAIL
jgi:hypothetical protein